MQRLHDGRQYFVTGAGRGVRLAKNDFGSVFGSVLQKKTAVFGSVSVLQKLTAVSVFSVRFFALCVV